MTTRLSLWPSRLLRSSIIVGRVAAVVLAILALHLFERVPWLYFLVLGVAAVAIFFGFRVDIPALDFLKRLGQSDRLAVWLVLFCLGLIGFVHTSNEWITDGHFLRPAHVGLWKTELVLVIATVAPMARWAPSVFSSHMVTVNGRRFAAEFALYVNFSGIALAFWTDEAAISWRALVAAVVLVVLVELTSYATFGDR